MGIALIVIIALLGLAVLPQMWVKSVIQRHSGDRADFPGSGGAFARHLLDGMKLSNVQVEETTMGDHYDPEAKTVRLLPEHHNGRSLSAIVIAAHEVGHAMQDATGYKPLAQRTAMAKQAHRVQKVGVTIMLLAPVAMLFTKAPFLMILQIAGGLMVLAFTVLMHALTLPVEFDASFKRALPLLEQGGYLRGRDVADARQILRAAALTYVAAAAMSLLDVARWFRILRV